MNIKQPFEKVYEEYYDKIYSYVFSILLNKSNAENIVQDTFLAHWKTIGCLTPKDAWGKGCGEGEQPVFPDRADLRVPRRSDDGAGGYPDDPDHRAPWRRRKAS